MTGAELRAGMALRVEGAIYLVLEATYHGGQGKMGGVMHAKLRNAETGAVRERRFRADETVETITPERRELQFLYQDGGISYFMDPGTFEQLPVENARLGRAAHFLQDGMTVPVQFIDERPIGIVFPDVVEATIAETAPPSHGQGVTNVWKEARLDNGLTILVPPFIAPGEVVRVDVERGTYLERAKKK